jgi:luciferase family oxidoreductase group 1
MAMRLSVLDQSPIAEGSTGADALANTLDLARLTDQLGYHRYWVAEHHGGPMLASASPEVLIGPIASATSRIRVGSGGVMLPHYSPFKVAETFTILAALYPGRIDLGLGRASGTDPLTTFALQRDRRQASPDDFPDQLAELLAYLEGSIPSEHPFARLASVLPGRPAVPDVWLLGSSAQSAVWAAQLGIAYAFADFINPGGAAIAGVYRDRFAEGERRLTAPMTAVAAWVLCAETDEEAQRLAASSRMTMTLLRRGQLIPVPPVEKAMAFLEAEGRSVAGGSSGGGSGSDSSRLGGRRGIVGSPATVRAGLDELAAEYQADEVIIVTITFDHEARRRSYELIAREMGLVADDATAAASAPR